MARSQRIDYLLAYPRLLGLWRRNAAITMIPRDAYIGNLFLVSRALRDPALAGGCIVECGTWRGGMSCGLLAVGGIGREYHFFDSFEGLPPAGALDGARAVAWQAEPGAPKLNNNCAATYDEVSRNLARAALRGQRYEIHRGWFQDTLPAFPRDKPIAVLRLDGDWYDSTMVCLDYLFDKVMPGGIILLDDYLHWEGCTRAVHDFLASRKAAEGIRQSRFGGVSWIRKQAPAG
ncbi:MAG TPA: TylF/MycF/NovP-related O-methyltransferase [Alphaproteobacteria bacterium]|jgi:O-methyltransferase